MISWIKQLIERVLKIRIVEKFLKIRIIRYGMVGGVGILVNDAALFCFKSLLGLVLPAHSIFLYPIASACAFEVSNIINFVLNQFFTYSEQVKGIHGREWVRRAAKGQLTSLSAMLLSYLVGLALVFFLHVNDYLANPAGIVVAFVYNFFISNKLVFRATAPINTTPGTMEDTGALHLEGRTKAESTPR